MKRQAGCALLHLKLQLLSSALSISTHLEAAWELLLVNAIANSLHAHTRIKSWFSNNSLHLSYPQVLIPFIASAALNCYPPSFILYPYHWSQFLPFSYLNPWSCQPPMHCCSHLPCTFQNFSIPCNSHLLFHVSWAANSAYRQLVHSGSGVNKLLP